MGFRQAAVLASVSFFTGVLFICMNVDYRLLWSLDDQAVKDGFVFYTTFYHAPPAIRALLHAMIGVGLLGLLSKLHKWDESAMFFDGSSIVAFVFGITVYLACSVPSIRTVVSPVEGVDTPEDQVQAMQLVSAGNVIILGLLGAILALQAGQEYSKRAERAALAKFEAEERKVTAEKKVQ